ncbi:hypothetical protein QEW_3485 [Clostridioides difficile CD160]|nr:hypothetical protein QEW_3485 [Clostridioides difficile CD160]
MWYVKSTSLSKGLFSDGSFILTMWYVKCIGLREGMSFLKVLY